MHLTIKYKLKYELLQKIMRIGTTPDSIDQILILRVKDLLRKNKIPHEKIMVDVTRNHGVFNNLFMVTIHVTKLEYDIQEISIKLIENVQPYLNYIDDIDLIIIE